MNGKHVVMVCAVSGAKGVTPILSEWKCFVSLRFHYYRSLFYFSSSRSNRRGLHWFSLTFRYKFHGSFSTLHGIASAGGRGGWGEAIHLAVFLSLSSRYYSSRVQPHGQPRLVRWDCCCLLIFCTPSYNATLCRAVLSCS